MLPKSPENPQPPAEASTAELLDAATEVLPGLAFEKSDPAPLPGAGVKLGRSEAPPVPGVAARGGAPITPGTGQVEPKVVPAMRTEPECIQSLDLDGNILSINTGGRQVLGIGQTDDLRSHGKWSALWIGPGVEAATQAVAGARNGNTVRFDASLSTALGFSKYWEATVSAIPGQDGEPERLLAVLRPLVTGDAGADASQATVGIASADLQGQVLWAARHRTEQNLADVQVRLNAALTAGEIGTWVWEIPSDRVFADANLVRLFFLPPEVTNGAPLARFMASIHADDKTRVSDDIGQAVSTGGAFDTEYRLVSQEGTVRWVVARGTVELDEGGQASRFFGVVLDITGRKQAEQALATTAEELAQQSRIFNTVLSATDDFAYLFDLGGRFLYANRRLLEVWGMTLPEIVGKDCYELGYPDWHADKHMREIREVIETRQPVKGEVSYSSPTGHYGMYEYTFTPVFGSDGKVEVIAGTTHDVTEKRGSDEALRDSKQRLDLVIDAAQLGTFDWTLPVGTGSINLNNRLRDFFWLPRDAEVTREMIEEKVHPADRPAFRRAIREALVEGKRYDFEYRVQGPEGQVRWVRAIGKSFRDQNGVLVRFGGILIDISSQKQAEAELRAGEARFRQLADSMPQIVWGARPDGILDYSNQRWYEYVDKTEAEISPNDWAEYVYPDDLAGAGAAWAAALGEGTEYSTEFRVRRADGAYRWFLVRALPIRAADGAIQRWYGTCTDIHNQKELQQERENLLSSEQAARTEAERASRMKDEFLSTLSHELRTPLNAILGWAQVLRSTPVSASPAPEAEADTDLEIGLATIERNARAQAQIIEDLLDMSRIISGKVRLDVQRVDLAPVVRAAIDTMLPAAEAKAIRLQSILDPQASPVSGDPNRLQQIFWNILSNAIRFTPRGGRVQVILQRINSHLEVRFSDSGEGIALDFLPHVFDRFSQADSSSTRRHGGLGLGLAIVKQLTELHGGTVKATSDGPGTGATFVVSLPLMVAVRSAGGSPAGISPQDLHTEDMAGGGVADEQNGRRHPQSGGLPSMRGGVLEVNLQRLRVLVVDDEADARTLLRRLLEERGAEVIVASSAEEAFNLVMTEQPDVLVSDIGMPDEDGYSLIRRIRAQEAGGSGGSVAGSPAKLPAVALTAYARAEDRMRAVLAGFQMHVSKPVEAAELLAMVASLSGRT